MISLLPTRHHTSKKLPTTSQVGSIIHRILPILQRSKCLLKVAVSYSWSSYCQNLSSCCQWKTSSFRRSSCRSVHVSEPYNKMDSIQVWYKQSFVCSWSRICRQTFFIECMAVEAMPMRLIMSGWHLPVVDWTDPRYVNSVTSSSEWPQTGRQGVDSPAPRFWIFVFCKDTRKLSSQRMILGIRWHDFVRNTEVFDRTNLPCVQDIIAKQRNSLFGHVVRLDDHMPAHRALSQVAAARTGSRFGPGWRRRPGRPRHSWIQQIGDGTPFSTHAE